MSHSLQARSAIFAIAMLGMLGASACAPHRVETTSSGEVALSPMPSRRASDVLASWPAKQRETGTMVIAKYGEPAIVGDRMLVWFNNGPFVKTFLLRDSQAHDFPMPHMDYLTQTVKHTVPASKLDAADPDHAHQM
ncbi:MAG: hypothetical protein LH467_04690 [Gemmatimonadaceae bacterium]|nr:hypothetical protein [Gemmatimonadaceae bacterium]